MKLVSLNIEVNKHHDTVIPFLKTEDPDVVCIQELLEEDLDLYKKELGLQGSFQADRYVVPRGEERGKKEGIAIFAKNIVNSGSVFYYGKEDDVNVPFSEYVSRDAFRKNYALVWADIAQENKIYKFINLSIFIFL